jgi:hypothetical protein
MWRTDVQANQTVVREYVGTGLGLSIVRSLVQAMNGQITVCSTRGVGTLFCVSLRLRRAGPADEPSPTNDKLSIIPSVTSPAALPGQLSGSQPSSGTDSKMPTPVGPSTIPMPSPVTLPAPASPSAVNLPLRPHVLVVDDQPINRQIIARMISHAYHTSFAENGKVAVEMGE